MNTPLRSLRLGFSLLVGLTPASLMLAQDMVYWGGGTADIADGTALPSTSTGLAGTWSATTANWSSGATSTDYAPFTDGAIANFGYWTDAAGSTVTLANNFSVGGIVNNTTLVNNNTTLTATAPRVITATGDTFVANIVRGDANTNTNFSFAANVTLAGASGTTLYKTGQGRLAFNSASNAFLGPVLIDRGALQINSSGSFNGSTAIAVRGVTLPHVGSAGSNNSSMPIFKVTANGTTAQNQLNDNLNVNLSYGTFEYDGISGASAGSTETIGKITVNGFGVLQFSNNSFNGVQGTLTLSDATAGIDRGSSGLGTMVVRTFGTAGANQGRLTTNLVVNNGVPTGQLLPWMVTDRGEFLQVNASTKILERITPTDAAADLSTWASTYNGTSNVRVGGNNAAFTPTGSIGNATVNALSIFTSTAGNSASPTLTIGAGNTLTLQSGLLAYQAGAAAYVSGGSITSATDKLYISGGSSNAAALTIASKITGNLDLVVSSQNAVNLTTASGVSNDYTGTTYVNGGHLAATSVGNSVVIAGDVVVESNGSLGLNGPALGAGKNVTLNSGRLNLSNGQTLSGVITSNNGVILFGNSDQTLNNAGTGLVFNGGSFSHNSGSTTNNLNLITNVSYSAGSTTQARFERLNPTGTFNIRLTNAAGTAERTFNIADSASLGAGVAEMVVDTSIVNGTGTGAIRKTGTGTLQLTSANSYSGGTTIDGGTIQLSTIEGAALSGLTATSSGDAGGGSILTFTQDGITDSMAVGQTVSGNGIATGRYITRILNGYQVQLSGSARASGSGVSTDISVNAVSRSGSLGTGAVSVNNTGRLLVDSGISVNNSVSINSGGSFVNNGSYSGTLTFGGTGGVLGGSGTFASAVAITTGNTLAPGNSPGLATFSGGLTLQTGSNFNFELAANTVSGRGTQFDGVNVTGGTLTVQSGVNFNVTLNALGSSVNFADAFWTAERSWLVFSNTNEPSLVSLFNLGTVTADSAGNAFGTLNTTGASFAFQQIGNDIYLTYGFEVIPEASSFAALAGLGALGYAASRRRRRA